MIMMHSPHMSYNESFLADQDKVIAYLEKPNLKEINKDPAFTLNAGFYAGNDGSFSQL